MQLSSFWYCTLSNFFIVALLLTSWTIAIYLWQKDPIWEWNTLFRWCFLFCCKLRCLKTSQIWTDLGKLLCAPLFSWNKHFLTLCIHRIYLPESRIDGKWCIVSLYLVTPDFVFMHISTYSSDPQTAHLLQALAVQAISTLLSLIKRDLGDDPSLSGCTSGRPVSQPDYLYATQS